MEFDKIKSIISEVLSIDADGITEETTFVDRDSDRRSRKNHNCWRCGRTD